MVCIEPAGIITCHKNGYLSLSFPLKRGMNQDQALYYPQLSIDHEKIDLVDLIFSNQYILC